MIAVIVVVGAFALTIWLVLKVCQLAFLALVLTVRVLTWLVTH
jgi:hypothetical protein